MITNIVLDNIASYKSKAELVTDKRVNIIYGLNGSGKSTFSNYFYNPSEEEYLKCSHLGSYDEILVYNKKFIQDNFYSKDTLNGIFSLSKENKDAIVKIEEIKSITDELKKTEIETIKEIERNEKEIKNSQDESQNKTWDIKLSYTGGDRVLEFCLKGKMGSKESLFNHLASIPLPLSKPNKTILLLKDEANSIEGDAAIKHSMLNEINQISLPENELNSLNEIISGSKDSPISQLIDNLKNADWVSEGIKYIHRKEGSQCPFCQSETITENLIAQLENYFDDSYNHKISNIKKIHSDYEEITKTIPKLEDYSHSIFSRDFIADLSECHSNISYYANENLGLILNKISNPSIPVKLTDMSNDISKFNGLIKSINALINSHNSRIDNAEIEMKRLKTEFWDILRYEYDLIISTHKKLESECNKEIDNKQKELLKTKESLILNEKQRQDYQKTTVNIDEAIDYINKGLLDIGISDFHIKKHGDDLYRIVREKSDSKIFSSLSEGEKVIISLLYFRELFRGKKNASEGQIRKIAIIDDPVSSLSHIFVYNIGQLLKHDFFNSTAVSQTFILTHSLYFFYEIADSNHLRRKENQNLFRISKNSTGSTIETLKYEEIQNDYQSYWSIINDEAQHPALIANCMRNVVEYFFNFVQKSDLSNTMQKPELQEPRFQAFIRYINRESHSLGQNIFDFKEFNYNDFKDGLRLIFDKTGYESHYEKMSKIKK